jgi:hypothetical protein
MIYWQRKAEVHVLGEKLVPLPLCALDCPRNIAELRKVWKFPGTLHLIILQFFSPNATQCPCRFRGRPRWLWLKYNRLLWLRRRDGTVTLPPWCEWWWYVWAWNTRRGLKPKFYKLPRPWSLWGSSPARENSQGRTWNRTRDLMVSSQKLWPPSHEADHVASVALWMWPSNE